MEPYVFFAVLFGAACHAGWNSFLKVKLEPFSAIALIAIMSALVVLPMVPFLGVPVREAWPWIAASVAFHLGYFIALTEAYRIGDMGQVYPIARGSAPLMTALVSTLVIGEAIGVRGWLGVIILTAGVFLLSLRGGRNVRFEQRTVAFALATAVTIWAMGPIASALRSYAIAGFSSPSRCISAIASTGARTLASLSK